MNTSNELSQVNDYAIANAMNEEIYSALVSVYLGDAAGVSEFHEIPNLNRAYVLLVNELQQIYARNPQLQSIKPDPLWKRFDVLKNHTEEICDYIKDTEDWGLEHMAKVDKLCIIAGAENPEYNPEQQELMDNLKKYSKEYGSKGKELWDKSRNNIQIPLYSLTYELNGNVLINGVLKLKKAHAGSTTERLLEQALKSPHTLFKPDVGHTTRNLSTILSSAGFTKELRELFFPTVSNSKGIIFRPTVTRQQADDEKIDTSELDMKLKKLGARIEPKST